MKHKHFGKLRNKYEICDFQPTVNCLYCNWQILDLRSKTNLITYPCLLLKIARSTCLQQTNELSIFFKANYFRFKDFSYLNFCGQTFFYKSIYLSVVIATVKTWLFLRQWRNLCIKLWLFSKRFVDLWKNKIPEYLYNIFSDSYHNLLFYIGNTDILSDL